MKFVVLSVAVLALSAANIFIGAVNLSWAEVAAVLTGAIDDTSPISYIVWGSRVPQAATALLCGAALGSAGLMMQTMFRNPLAGPSILGISSGASLGVALVMLGLGSTLTIGSMSLSGSITIIIGAFAGSLAVMGALMALSAALRNDLMLIISGVMIGYLASSLITLLNYSASAQGVQGYMFWGMGTFNAVSQTQLPLFAVLLLAGLTLSVMMIKPLNALLLGDNYATNLGVNIKSARQLLLLSSGLITAVTTAFCGPVSFIGLAVPHIARLIWRTDNHRALMPGTMLCGAATALLCTLISVLPSGGIVPVNAVTPIVGVPVILYVLIRRRR